MKEFTLEIMNMFGYSEGGILLYLLNYLLFFYLSVYLLLIVHEFGHYIIAKLSGKKNISVVIGSGKTLKIGSWSFGILPTVGKTRFTGKNTILITAGGLLSSLVLHLAILPISNPYVMLFNLFNLINIFGNLVPFGMNDGKVMLMMMFGYDISVSEEL